MAVLNIVLNGGLSLMNLCARFFAAVVALIGAGIYPLADAADLSSNGSTPPQATRYYVPVGQLPIGRVLAISPTAYVRAGDIAGAVQKLNSRVKLLRGSDLSPLIRTPPKK